MVIFKYPIETSPVVIRMPRGARVLTVQLQQGVPTIWCLVDDEEPLVHRRLVVVGTGRDLEGRVSEKAVYVGTWQANEWGEQVRHLFDEGEVP